MSSHDYWRKARHHYDQYADHWFGGAYSWRHFIHACEPAPWFWNHYTHIYQYPWVFGYYDPVVYVRYGWPAPFWYGHVYYPWWDWCDAPFVYYYYQYPARFSFSYSFGSDYDVAYADILGGNVSVAGVFDRPLGVWVPGHYDVDIYGNSVWVPGYYVY